MTAPLVTVVVPTHDRPRMLERALESVLTQSYDPLEVLVVDDGSTPPARPGSSDPRLRLLRKQTASGAAAARNAGLDAAAGELICFLDDDDWFLPEKLSTQVGYLRQHPEVDLVFSQVVVLESDGTRSFCLSADHHHDPVENLRLGNAIHTNSALFRRRVTERVRFDERLTRYTDSQFFMAAALRFTTHYLPVEVAVWNRHGDGDRLTQPDLEAARRNFALLCSILHEDLERHPEIQRQYRETLDTLEVQALHAAFGLSSPQPAIDPIGESPPRAGAPAEALARDAGERGAP